MAEQTKRRGSRRDLVRVTGAGALGAMPWADVVRPGLAHARAKALFFLFDVGGTILDWVSDAR